MESNTKTAMPSVKQTFMDIWETRGGKVLVIGIAGTAALGLAAGFLKVCAITINQYKDFRDALRR